MLGPVAAVVAGGAVVLLAVAVSAASRRMEPLLRREAQRMTIAAPRLFLGIAGLALAALTLDACNSSSTLLSATATSSPCVAVPTTPPAFALVSPANGATAVPKSAGTLSFTATGNLIVLAATLTSPNNAPVVLASPAPPTTPPVAVSPSPTATPVPPNLYLAGSPALAGSTAYTLHVNAVDKNSCTTGGQDFVAGSFATGP